ncbi:AAA family ATPase [Jannaschia sp. Os4]|uniref:AAA family ATPase n=1 Tax=Jannaschia sp. Os4 TaxID=2807617 RepID=UPI0019396421|nr:AAA family ATPase [Jannaschia sp. Os4]MBM2574848.1 AAA family ATPase [Jannaschia sp. Os4]
MTATAALQPEPAPLRAVTVSRDIQAYDLLIDGMEACLGEAWGDLTFEEADVFVAAGDADGLELMVFALDDTDEGDLDAILAIVKAAKAAGPKIILVADSLSPQGLHALLRVGADDFAPYPISETALAETIDRLQSDRAEVAQVVAAARAAEEQGADAPRLPATGGRTGRESRVVAFHGLAGGVGATTIATNLAWEVAQTPKGQQPLSVCIMDLDLQFGSVATLMDLPCKSQVLEILSDTDAMDEQAFRQSLSAHKGGVQVFTAPSEIVPYDMVSAEDVLAVLKLARSCFDVTIIDMPQCVTQWTDAVMGEADVYHGVLQLEVRAAQNALRLRKLLRSEGVSPASLGWMLNRAPGKGDLQAKGRIDRMAETLSVEFGHMLPDGKAAVQDAADQGVMLGEAAPKNPLRRELRAMADAIVAEVRGETVTAEAGQKKSIFGLKFG